MEHERFRETMVAWRSEFVLPVMADDEMFEQGLEIAGKPGSCSAWLEHLQFDDHVTGATGAVL